MAPKAIWKGAMGFGMVSVPVKLYSATEEKGVHFNQLHKDCGGRVNQPKRCLKCNKFLEAADIVKGYPVGDDQYVLMEETDFSSLPVKSLNTIDVVAFVEGSQIDPRHYNKPYFLAPEDAGIKAFGLFLKAMAEVNMVGICKLGYREREHLATIRAFGGVILLQTLYYSDELRNPDEVRPRMVEVSDREMQMAVTLLQTLKVATPSLHQYEDEYRKALLDRITAKLNGQPIIAVETAKEEPQMDLVDALMASINAENKAKENTGTLAERIAEFSPTGVA